MKTPLAVCLAALTLSACNKPAGAPAAKAPVATGSGGVSAAAAVAAPMRRAGLWEQTMMRDGGQAMGPMAGPVKLCLDATTDAQMHVFGRQFGRGMCQQQAVTRGP